MAESRLCPECGKVNLHRFTSHTIKNTGKGIEMLNEETYWKCMMPECEYKKQERSEETD
jgi:predicted RNA-binding Zn-ribbon protein involved in translation (DUF1610 family)